MVKKIVVNCKSTGKPGPCKKTGQAVVASKKADKLEKEWDTGPLKALGGVSKQTVRDAHYAAMVRHRKAKSSAANENVRSYHDLEETRHQNKVKMFDSKGPTANSTGDLTMTKRERQELINTLVANGCGCWTQEDRDILRAFEPDRLRKLVANSLKSAKDEATLNTLKEKLGVDEFTEEFIANMEVNNDDEEPVTNCGDGMEGEEMPKKKKKQVPVANTEGEEQMTEQEWFENAPPSIRAVIESAMQVNNEAKQELVAKLTANASGDKKALTQLFMGKSIAELKLLTSALPKPTVNQQQQQPQSGNRLSLAFFGGQAAGSPTTNSVLDGGEFDKDDFLPIPTINFGENN